MPERLPRRDLASLDEVRALAHPLRQRILYHLAFTGPATATTIARAFDSDTGTTSYHLRQLERFGFIEQDRGRSSRRDKWWRLVPLDLRDIAEELRESEESRRLGRLQRARDRELVERYLENQHRFGDVAEAAMFSSSATRLTKEELAQFTEEYVALLKRWWRPDERDDALPIAVLFYAFPWPGE